MKGSNRSKSRTESLPVYLIALIAIAFGVLLIWVSWQVEDAQENSSHARSTTARRASTNDAPDKSTGDETSPVSATPAQTILPNPTSNASLIPAFTSPRWKIVSKGLGEFGLALISVGFIAVILEMRLMSDYFQGKIARSMTGRDYLKKLTKDQLEELQADSLRAYWGLEEKDREDLLDYCKDQVHGFIAKPYRENVQGSFSVVPINNSEQEVMEQLSWTCRVVKGKIQDEVRWSTRIGEIVGPQEFRITLEIPLNAWSEPEFRKQHPRIRERVSEFDMHKPKNGDSAAKALLTAIKNHYDSFWASLHPTNADERADQTPSGLVSTIKEKVDKFWGLTDLEKLCDSGEPDREGYKLSLLDYRNVDRLHVDIFTKYRAPVGRSLTWQMSHPTKTVNATVYFEERRFFLETFGLPDECLHHDKSQSADFSPQRFDYDSWLLPECGFVFHFLPKTYSPESPETSETTIV